MKRNMGKKVIVVGGGIVGLSCAYYLQKAGHTVTVLDKSEMQEGASRVNAGYLTPSHIIPLAAPGVMAKGLKWMFNSNSPFYLKPRLDSEFLRWAWYFHKSSTPEKVARAIPLIAEINLLSKVLYQDILASGDLGNFQLELGGLLMLFKSEHAAKEEREVLKKANDLGLEGSELTESELHKLQPNLKPDITTAFHYQCDAHTTPGQIMALMQDYLKSKGVSIIDQTEVTGFDTFQNTVTAVHTRIQKHTADEVVLAAGSWTGKLSKMLNFSLSLEAGKGYRINVPRPTPVKMPALLMDAKVAVTPMVGFTRFAGTMELSGINHNIRLNRVKAIADAGCNYYEGINFEPGEIDGAACGLRPVSPDGLPYIGRPGNWTNVSVAAGHAMMGWSLGPVTGKLISEIIDGTKPSLNLDAYAPLRRF